MQKMVKAEGWQVLFAGIWPANVWAVPYYGMFFFTYVVVVVVCATCTGADAAHLLLTQAAAACLRKDPHARTLPLTSFLTRAHTSETLTTFASLHFSFSFPKYIFYMYV